MGQHSKQRASWELFPGDSQQNRLNRGDAEPGPKGAEVSWGVGDCVGGERKFEQRDEARFTCNRTGLQVVQVKGIFLNHLEWRLRLCHPFSLRSPPLFSLAFLSLPSVPLLPSCLPILLF